MSIPGYVKVEDIFGTALQVALTADNQFLVTQFSEDGTTVLDLETFDRFLAGLQNLRAQVT